MERPVNAQEVISNDPMLGVDLLQRYSCPEQVVYQAAKTDYSEVPITDRDISSVDYGQFIVEELLGGNRGHWGPLEHPHMTILVKGFDHSVMVQARTHRVGVSFDVQSQRYTGKRVVKVASGELDVSEVFYFRRPGFYLDRRGRKYWYSQVEMFKDMEATVDACQKYRSKLELGFAEEHARMQLPQNIRQNFVVTFNLRSVLHFLDLRSKKDAQVEIQAMCEAMAPYIQDWAPNVWEYYSAKRLYKAQLAP